MVVLIPVSVGYEYESCLDLTLWEKRTAILQGYELDASNMGGWTLDKHHVLDVQNGKTLFIDSYYCLTSGCFDHSNIIAYVRCRIRTSRKKRSYNVKDYKSLKWELHNILLMNFKMFLYSSPK